MNTFLKANWFKMALLFIILLIFVYVVLFIRQYPFDRYYFIKADDDSMIRCDRKLGDCYYEEVKFPRTLDFDF